MVRTGFTQQTSLRKNFARVTPGITVGVVLSCKRHCAELTPCGPLVFQIVELLTFQAYVSSGRNLLRVWMICLPTKRYRSEHIQRAVDTLVGATRGAAVLSYICLICLATLYPSLGLQLRATSPEMRPKGSG
jgi:hypothetical protein